MSFGLARELRVWATEREAKRRQSLVLQKAEEKEKSDGVDADEDEQRKKDLFTMVGRVLREMEDRDFGDGTFVLVCATLQQTPPDSRDFGRVYSAYFRGTSSSHFPEPPQDEDKNTFAYLSHYRSCYEEINPLGPFLTICANNRIMLYRMEQAPTVEQLDIIADATRKHATPLTVITLLCVILSLLMASGIRHLFRLDRAGPLFSSIADMLIFMLEGVWPPDQVSSQYTKHVHMDGYEQEEVSVDWWLRHSLMSCGVGMIISIPGIIRLVMCDGCDGFCSKFFKRVRVAIQLIGCPLPAFSLLLGVLHLFSLQMDMVSCALISWNAGAIVVVLCLQSKTQAAFFRFSQLQSMLQFAFLGAFIAVFFCPWSILLSCVLCLPFLPFLSMRDCFRLATDYEYTGQRPLVPHSHPWFPVSKLGLRVAPNFIFLQCLICAFCASAAQFNAQFVIIILFLCTLASVSVLFFGNNRTVLVYFVAALIVISAFVPIPGAMDGLPDTIYRVFKFPEQAVLL